MPTTGPASRTGSERLELLPRILEAREIGDGDPPARCDGGLLGAGGGEDGLRRCLQQQLTRIREFVMPGGPIGVRGRLRKLEIAGERFLHRDRIGLGVDDDPLVVGDRPAHVRVGALDRRERRRVSGHGVRHPLALDQAHIRAGRRDDQPVTLDQRDRQHLRQRAGHARNPSNAA